ncbi:MAG: cation diffusion facilitator family transporter, partial [Desulfobulbaceae bacterium]|nr:cation diffusion facilitator family transporter [Desulfobulbaceae bacterium]
IHGRLTYHGRMNPANHVRRAAATALAISLLLLIGKFTAYYLTGSKAVLSDAIESIINVVAAAFLLFSVTIGSQPADECHPYGHGKIESFSVGLEGGLILLAGIIIFAEAIPAFFVPAHPQRLDAGILLLAGAGLVNLGFGLHLLRQGKKHKSDALTADGHHLMTDFYTSAGVIVGLIAVRFTGWLWLDPLVACLMAVNILVPGVKLARNAFRDLMNEADPSLLSRIVAALNRIDSATWHCPHRLRVIRSGIYHHIDLHITVPNYWTLSRAHDVEKEVASALLGAIDEEGDVMIHLDPCHPSCCNCCKLEPCPERSSRFTGHPPWTIANVIARHPNCPVDPARTTAPTG